MKARSYGEYLTVYFASRLDQVHFKLYAAVDPSAGFDEILRQVLAHYGVDDGDR